MKHFFIAALLSTATLSVVAQTQRKATGIKLKSNTKAQTTESRKSTSNAVKNNPPAGVDSNYLPTGNDNSSEVKLQNNVNSNNNESINNTTTNINTSSNNTGNSTPVLTGSSSTISNTNSTGSSNTTGSVNTSTGNAVSTGSGQIGSTRNSIEAGGTGVGSNGATNTGAGTTGNPTAGSTSPNNSGNTNSTAPGATNVSSANTSTTNTNNNNNNSSTTTERPANVPDQVFSTFSAANAAASNVTWSNENGKWTAKYMLGDTWLQSNYNATGRRIDTRTEISMTDPNLIPKGVATYRDKNSELKINKITRIEAPGAAEQYEIRTDDGKTITVNRDGSSVNLK